MTGETMTGKVQTDVEETRGEEREEAVERVTVV